MPTSGRGGAGGGEADPVTLGEVARNLEKLAEQMERGFERVDERFNTLAMVHADVYLADRAADSERYNVLKARVDVLDEEKMPARLSAAEREIKRVVEGNRWLSRTVIGAVVVLIVSAVWALAATGISHP